MADAIGFIGFLPPIGGANATGGSAADTLRTFKLGRMIPVKFQASQCGGPLWADEITGWKPVPQLCS